MNKVRGFFLVMMSWSMVVGCSVSDEGDVAQESDSLAHIPYYYIAIHNEPSHRQNGQQSVAESYTVLKQMVARADSYKIKLTLMFSAQWSDYIMGSAARQAEVAAWKASGHELSSHHHSIYHGNWDGYTAYTKQEAEAQREKQNVKPEQYLGTLDDYWVRLKKLDTDVRSGCANDEADKKVLPDGVVYDTCSGFANYGPVGQRATDTSAVKGKNEYATVGTVNNIERTWLTHFQITTDARQKEAQTVFATMSGATVYGSVTHSVTSQAEPFYSFLEFLHAQDPTGARSRTVTEIVEQGILTEKTISSEVLNTKYTSDSKPPSKGKCGDGACDPLEKADPKLCPKDCK